MHRTTLALLLLAACVDADQVGVTTSASTVNTSKTNRWYSSTIKYYADPSLSTQHWKALWRALHDNYNVLTPVDFEPGCNDDEAHPISESNPPTCVPAVTSSTPYIMYVDANIATGGRTMSGSDLHESNPTLSEVAPTRAVMRNWREVRTAAHGFCTDTTHCTDTGQPHDDYVVAFPTLSTGTGSDWGPEPLDLRTPLHETGHVLGMIHEQRRPDATDHLNIYTCCVSSDFDSSIQPYDDAAATYLGKWDYDSIMMYSSSIESGQSCYNFLAKSGEGVGSAPSPIPTTSCVPLQDGDDTSGSVGSPVYQLGTKVVKKRVLSKEDINTVYQMYPRSLGSDEANDHFGKAMAAGDFDHDGYTDLAVGVPRERYGSETTESGMVYVFKGTFTGLEPWMLLHTSVPYGELGSSLAALDVDSDGTTDLVVGAPGSDLGSGAVWLYRGSSTGLGSGRQVSRASAIGDRFGETVHAIRKDSNEVDFAVGMPGRSMVEVYDASGSWSSLTVPKVRTYTGPANSQYGAALGAGEVDGDGNHDLLIGAPGNRRVYIAHGIATGPGTLVTWISDPYTTSGSEFGASVIAAHLESGADDIVVGAPGADGGTGRAYRFNHAFALRDTLLPSDFGQNPFLIQDGRFGATLAAGMLYSTGTYDHVVVGMPDASIEGQVGLYHITNGSLEQGNVYGALLTTGVHSHFGAALAIGNFDDKGPPELAIGEPDRSSSAGQGWILHGRTSGAPSYTADGSENNTTILTQAGTLTYRR